MSSTLILIFSLRYLHALLANKILKYLTARKYLWHCFICLYYLIWQYNLLWRLAYSFSGAYYLFTLLFNLINVI